MSRKRMVSFVAPSSLIDDVESLVRDGKYTHMSDAWRGVSKLGVGVEKENGEEKVCNQVRVNGSDHT